MKFLIVLIKALFSVRTKPRGYSRPQRDDRAYTASRSKPKRPSIVTRQLMGKGEQRLFRMLNEALPDHFIFPQVSFNALLTHAPHIWGDNYRNAVRRKFHHKYVDFVVCDRVFEVVAVVEYDGSGHDGRADAYRDGMLTDAGYRVERFTQTDTPDMIRQRLAGFIKLDSQEVDSVGEEKIQF